jgi:hypothetical protein
MSILLKGLKYVVSEGLIKTIRTVWRSEFGKWISTEGFGSPGLSTITRSDCGFSDIQAKRDPAKILNE